MLNERPLYLYINFVKKIWMCLDGHFVSKKCKGFFFVQYIYIYISRICNGTVICSRNRSNAKHNTLNGTYNCAYINEPISP